MKKNGECGKKHDYHDSHQQVWWKILDSCWCHRISPAKWWKPGIPSANVPGDGAGVGDAHGTVNNRFPLVVSSPSWPMFGFLFDPRHSTAKSACLIIFACPIPTPFPIHQTRDRFSCIPPFWCGFKIVQENLQPAPHIRIAGGACSDVHPAKFLGKVAWNIPISPLRLICSCT